MNSFHSIATWLPVHCPHSRIRFNHEFSIENQLTSWYWYKNNNCPHCHDRREVAKWLVSRTSPFSRLWIRTNSAGNTNTQFLADTTNMIDMVSRNISRSHQLLLVRYFLNCWLAYIVRTRNKTYFCLHSSFLRFRLLKVRTTIDLWLLQAWHFCDVITLVWTFRWLALLR